MITLEKAAKYYNGTCAFRIPQLTIEDGQIVGLLGENGAGKTSLLKVLAGVTDHDGTVLIDGQPPRKSMTKWRLSPKKEAGSVL